MSTTGNMRLAFVIEAIDRATATTARINKTIDKVTQPIKRVREATTALLRESRFEKVHNAWQKLGAQGSALMSWGRGAASMLLGLGVAAGGAAFGLKRAIDGVDQVLDQSKKLGVSVPDMQRWGYAAQMNGSNAQAMGDALRFLSTNMVDAANGSKEAQQWFARVGIPLERLRKMNVLQVAEQISDTFKRVGDGGQNAAKKIALTRALMGRSGDELVQMFNQGSKELRRFFAEADELGGVVGQEAAEAMGDFNDQFDRMSFAVRGGIAAIASAALPALDQLVKRTTAWTVANRELVASRVAEFVERVLPKLPAFAENTMQVVGAVAALIGTADRVAQSLGGWEAVIGVVAALMIGKGVLAVYAMTTALWGMGVALAATPFGWALAAVAALAAIATVLIAKWEPIKQFFREISEDITKAGSAAAWVVGLAGRAFSAVASGVKASMTTSTTGQPTQSILMSTFGGGRQEVGGTLRVEAAPGTRVTQVRQQPGSVMDIDVYSGMTMTTP